MSDAVAFAIGSLAFSSVLLTVMTRTKSQPKKDTGKLRWTEQVVDASEGATLTIWARDRDILGVPTDYRFQPRCACGWRTMNEDDPECVTGAWFMTMEQARRKARKHRCEDLNIFGQPKWHGAMEDGMVAANPAPLTEPESLAEWFDQHLAKRQERYKKDGGLSR